MSDPEGSAKPLCFVVMGFGKKTDYETGRTLDLDKTYDNIVRPAAVAAGYRPVRADEVMHSSIIDGIMYEMLYQAELVIADISTSNANAIYELGVRHALRPKSTIILKESEGRYFFDLNHDATFGYKHLGEDIGASEAGRAQRDLEILIREVSAQGRVDSPVYTYLPKLREPRFSEEELEEIIEEAEARREHVSSIMLRAEKYISESNFDAAYVELARAHELRPSENYVLQRMVLARYKSETPSKLTSLTEALILLQGLRPEQSNDPETLGLAGAIHKRLWWESGDRPQLEKSAKYYGRGFEVRRDYYNGQNLADCYDMMAAEEQVADEAIYYRLSARKTREELRNILDAITRSPDFGDRADKNWVFATAAQVEIGLGNNDAATRFETQFRELGPADWELATFEKGISNLRGLLSKS